MQDSEKKLYHNFQLICSRLLENSDEKGEIPYSAFKSEDEREEFVIVSGMVLNRLFNVIKEYFADLEIKYGEDYERHINPKLKAYLEDVERLGKRKGWI